MSYWQPGHKLNNGKFVVEKLLGSGGFGVTYLVKQTRNSKLFALKTLNELARNRADFQQLQAKFINEAIALASCRHPHIVQVYPQGFQEGKLWCMVMEYVEGKDLARYIDQNGILEEKKAVEIISEVSNALGFVHETGLIHRDIKPANILVRNSNLSPVLIDFGLAREYTAGTIRTMTNSMTECYAPIEQYQTKGNFGAWTDIYALAATLYVLVTKEMPLPARFRTHAELPSPKQYNPHLSDTIERAILKGMELAPENRPQSVDEWLELFQPTQNQNIFILDDSPVTLQILEFDTVKVDNLGKLIHTEHHSAKYFTEDLGYGITLDMIEIPGGTFMMGSPENEKNRSDSKTPQYQVTLPSFYMAKFPITQAQWARIAALPSIERELESNPSEFKGNDLPVEKVSWYDAVEFCQRLAKITGKEYRLPSEAQWEYACRAKTTTPFYFGAAITTDFANYNGKYTYQNEPRGEYRQKTTPVGKFYPNAFGLYDMHGNVWEWCGDSEHNNYQGSFDDSIPSMSPANNIHVLRGGSWGSRPEFCRSAHRDQFIAEKSDNFIGLRCVITDVL